MLKKVAVLALPGTAPFEFGVVCEVFGVDRSDTGGPVFEFVPVTADPGPVRMSLGFTLDIQNGLEAAADADLIAVPAHQLGDIDPRYLDVIRDAAARGAWVLSVCSGAFVLAEGGRARRQAARPRTGCTPTGSPASTRRSRSTPTCCSSRTATSSPAPARRAGIDAALHIVRKEFGASATNVIARRMVVPPQRRGRAVAVHPEPGRRSARTTRSRSWPSGCSRTSRRTSASTSWRARRSCRAARSPAGSGPRWARPPAAWLNRQRLMRAQQLLEETDRGLETIAQETGFGTAAVMRHHFVKTLNVSPQAYRRAFGAAA